MSVPAKGLFVAVYGLVCLGIVMTYSASAVYAEHIYQNSLYFLTRQVLFVLIGTLALWISASIPAGFWRRHARWVMLSAIILMLFVFFPGIGRAAGGAQRWISIGAINFQPVEFAKIAVCIYLSDYLVRKMKLIQKGSLKVFFAPMMIVGGLCLISLLQPDLGSSFIILMTACLLFFTAGIRLRYIGTAFVLIVPLFYFLVARVPYRLSRITAYLNPWDDPQGSGFQIIQSFLAFGLGGVNGVGLGQSTQKLFYLPSSYNDFILSIIGEELGLVGLLAVIVLYAVLFICGIWIAERTKDDYGKLLSVSLTVLIVFQALINMFVATGLVPTKGLPLPFISYGGTSVVFNLIAIGILLSIDRQKAARSSPPGGVL